MEIESTLTDDELLQLSAVTAVIAPQLLRTYGRDFAKMGAELMQPETILPYWKDWHREDQKHSQKEP